MKNETLPKEDIAQAERIGLGDLVIAGSLAIFVFLFSIAFAIPGLHPSLWEDASVAASIRPSANILTGSWTFIASLVYSVFGIGFGSFVLRLMGHLSLAILVLLGYVILRELLFFTTFARARRTFRRVCVMRFAAAIGIIFFVFSEPVWMAFQCFSPTALTILLLLGALELFFAFLRKEAICLAYCAAALLGFLAASTAMGFTLAAVLIGVMIFIYKAAPTFLSPIFRASAFEVSKWHMTFLFIAAFVIGVVLNSWCFLAHDGTRALGQSFGDVPMIYLHTYFNAFKSAAGPLGWIVFLSLCVVPFVIACVRFNTSVDEERFLPYSSGLVYLVCGILALTQASYIPVFLFWTHFDVASPTLLAMGLFCLAATAAMSAAVLGVDSLCRNHAMIESLMSSDDEDDEDHADRDAQRINEVMTTDIDGRALSRTSVFLRIFVFVLVPIIALALVVPGGVKKATREMMQAVNDFAEEVVREAHDKKVLFTDGNLDPVIELVARDKGSMLTCYSLMGGVGARGRYLRTRDLKDGEDLFSFRFDTATGLRSWIRDKPERLADTAALMGFDLWKRDGRPLPPMGGVLSRPAGFRNEAERMDGVRRAYDLARRMIAVNAYAKGIKACTDRAISRAFYAAQWRLARMCLYRGEVDDAHGLADEAILEGLLAKQLNDCNKTYQDLVAAMEKRQSFMMQALTPREGLQLALVRADFTMGKVYAETILSADPDNPDANFAMGMYYQRLRQLSLAERYLMRTLLRKPNEPAVYNNLAMIQIELKKYEAARTNIEKALKIIPDAAAVLDTKRRLEAAVERQAHAKEKKASTRP